MNSYERESIFYFRGAGYERFVYTVYWQRFLKPCLSVCEGDFKYVAKNKKSHVYITTSLFI